MDETIRNTFVVAWSDYAHHDETDPDDSAEQARLIQAGIEIVWQRLCDRLEVEFIPLAAMATR